MAEKDREGVFLGVHVPQELARRLDRYRASQTPIPTKAKVLRAALEAFLKRKKR